MIKKITKCVDRNYQCSESNLNKISRTLCHRMISLSSKSNYIALIKSHTTVYSVAQLEKLAGPFQLPVGYNRGQFCNYSIKGILNNQQETWSVMSFCLHFASQLLFAIERGWQAKCKQNDKMQNIAVQKRPLSIHTCLKLSQILVAFFYGNKL